MGSGHSEAREAGRPEDKGGPRPATQVGPSSFGAPPARQLRRGREAADVADFADEFGGGKRPAAGIANNGPATSVTRSVISRSSPVISSPSRCRRVRRNRQMPALGAAPLGQPPLEVGDPLCSAECPSRQEVAFEFVQVPAKALLDPT